MSLHDVEMLQVPHGHISPEMTLVLGNVWKCRHSASTYWQLGETQGSMSSLRNATSKASKFAE